MCDKQDRWSAVAAISRETRKLGGNRHMAAAVRALLNQAAVGSRGGGWAGQSFCLVLQLRELLSFHDSAKCFLSYLLEPHK